MVVFRISSCAARDYRQLRPIMACDLNSLLMSGFYVVVSDLLSEAPEHLDSTVSLVAASMAVFRQSSKGFCAALDYSKSGQTASKPS